MKKSYLFDVLFDRIGKFSITYHKHTQMSHKISLFTF